MTVWVMLMNDGSPGDSFLGVYISEQAGMDDVSVARWERESDGVLRAHWGSLTYELVRDEVKGMAR